MQVFTSRAQTRVAAAASRCPKWTGKERGAALFVGGRSRRRLSTWYMYQKVLLTVLWRAFVQSPSSPPRWLLRLAHNLTSVVGVALGQPRQARALP